jgi:hypothetical protein
MRNHPKDKSILLSLGWGCARVLQANCALRMTPLRSMPFRTRVNFQQSAFLSPGATSPYCREVSRGNHLYRGRSVAEAMNCPGRGHL